MGLTDSLVLLAVWHAELVFLELVTLELQEDPDEEAGGSTVER